MKSAIIGAGNIGMALADGLVKSGTCTPADITLTRRNIHSIASVKEKGFAVTAHNSEAVSAADVVFLCVLPQQLNGVLDEIKDAIQPERHLLISVVTGVHT